MKPSWVALVSAPMSAGLAPHCRIRSSAALLAENQSEVPKSWAMTMMAMGWCIIVRRTFNATATGFHAPSPRQKPGSSSWPILDSGCRRNDGV